MDLESAQNNALAKLPLLKQDHRGWQLLPKNELALRTTTNADGTSTSTIPGVVTAEEKIQKKNDLKAQSILMMTLPSEHLLTFNQYKDAKTLFEAIKQFWWNKSDLGSISFDDLYNNFKIVEQEVKRSVISSSNSSSQNVAFVSTPSSTDDVNTSNVHVSTASSSLSTASSTDNTARLSDATIYAFLANQPNGSQVVHEDLEQIHEDELRMDLKWQIGSLKVECFDCHKMGHFARDCKNPKSQENRSRNQDNLRRTVNVEESSSKAMLAIDGISERIELNKSEFDLANYKRGLASVEEQLVFYKKNEGMLCDQIVVLKRDASFNESEINALKIQIERLKKEKERCQISDNNRKGVGYNAVAPPPTGLFAPPTIDLLNSGLEEFKQPKFLRLYGVSDCDEDETLEKVSESANVQKPKQADLLSLTNISQNLDQLSIHQMANLEFCDKHNMVAYLEKPEGSAEFHQIIDFLTATHIHYALTENLTIYASFIKQFWTTATASTNVYGEVKLTASIDGQAKTITEASLRRHLKLEDDGGITSLPNTEIFEQLALMGYTTDSDKLTFQKGNFSRQWRFFIHIILHCLSPKKTSWEHFSSNIATAIICLSTNRTFNFSKFIFNAMVKNLDNPHKFLMYPRFIQICLNKQRRLLQPHTRTYPTPVLTQKVFSNMKRVTRGYSGDNIPLFPFMITAPESSPSTYTNFVTQLTTKVGSLENELMNTKKVYGSALTKLVNRVKKLEKQVKTGTTRRGTKIVLLEDEAVEENSSKQGRSLIDELDMDADFSLVPPHDAEIQEKINDDTEVLLEEEETTKLIEEPTELVEDQGSGEKGEHEVTTADTALNTTSVPFSTASATPKIDEEERKRTARDAEIAKQLQEEYDKVRKKEAITEVDIAHVIDWDDPAIIRYHALQNRLRSLAEVRKNMMVYLKNQGGYKMKDFKGMSYDDIRLIFEKKIIRVGNHTEVYQIFEDMLKNFGRDDLIKLWSLVQERYNSSGLTEDKEIELWVELKMLFEPNAENLLELQKYMHDPLKWWLYDMCAVHHVSIEKGQDIFMLVEKDYPLTKGLATLMISNKLRVDQQSEMADELLTKIYNIANKSRK
ncbi:ribonuclease H-like domain-containing protein [Tanacetum coccineum]